MEKTVFDYADPLHIKEIRRAAKNHPDPAMEDFVENSLEDIQRGYYPTIEDPDFQELLKSTPFKDGFTTNEVTKNVAFFPDAYHQVFQKTKGMNYLDELEQELQQPKKYLTLSDVEDLKLKQGLKFAF
jgi:hypothetical protein